MLRHLYFVAENFVNKKLGNLLNLVNLKTELLCKGVKTEDSIEKGRKAGAGPAGGRFMILSNSSVVNVPLWPHFVKNSDIILRRLSSGWSLYKDGDKITNIELVDSPKFYSLKTSSGHPMYKIALLHGKDCLATTVLQKCVYWSTGQSCKFCGIENSLKDGSTVPRKNPKELVEVAGAAIEEGVCRHITLTTGTPGTPDRGAKILAETTRELKENYDVPIHVQLEPPSIGYLELLADVGVDTVGIHIENFDRAVLESVCPGKAQVSFDEYLKAWKEAVELFGETQVSTYIIVGLGEDDESILQGVEIVTRLGVVPFLVPFRPILGTEFENRNPPSASRMINLYRKVAEILSEYNLDPSRNLAGCVRCGACSSILEAFRYRD
ncbi:MAG: MSMEG_0568 family radical SAM protein [Candidatus Freyarchaeota archaeon]